MVTPELIAKHKSTLLRGYLAWQANQKKREEYDSEGMWGGICYWSLMGEFVHAHIKEQDLHAAWCSYHAVFMLLDTGPCPGPDFGECASFGLTEESGTMAVEYARNRRYHLEKTVEIDEKIKKICSYLLLHSSRSDSSTRL